MSSENGIFTVDMKRFHSCKPRTEQRNASTLDSSLKQHLFIDTRDESFLSNISERTEEDMNEDSGGDDDEETGDGVYYRRSYSTFTSNRNLNM